MTTTPTTERLRWPWLVLALLLGTAGAAAAATFLHAGVARPAETPLSLRDESVRQRGLFQQRPHVHRGGGLLGGK